MKKLLLIGSFAIWIFTTTAQQVGINATGNAPDATAMLDVAANNKGFLVPRMSMTDRDNIVSPANGLIIYNTDCNLLNYFDCDTWRKVGDEFGFPNLLNYGPQDYIYGKTNVSQNEAGVVYEIPMVSGSNITYTWTVPSGATIVSGQNTDRIVVDYGISGTGYICVEVDNGCGAVAKTCIHIEICPLPIVASISGNATPNQNQSGVTYSISPVAGANAYNWTVPVGAAIVSGQGTTSITVDFSISAQNGDVCVTATDDCGTSLPQCLSLTLGLCPVPNVPTTLPASSITSTDFDANWNAVSGATGYYIEVYDNSNNMIDNNSGNPMVGTTYSVSGLTCMSDYTYRVSAENACGSSAYSTVELVQTGSCCTPTLYAFTNCTKTGYDGPNQGQCDSEYGGTSLDGLVTVNAGIQGWTVPTIGTYEIEVAGAEGGTGLSDGGKGAIVKGKFNLSQGQQLKILVGQKGGNSLNQGSNDGGGGGSFVTDNTNSPIIIAGGGGGKTETGTYTTNNGRTHTSGGDTYQAGGGTNGNGGQNGIANGPGAGGGGLLTNGGDSGNSIGGKAFVNGGNGGNNDMGSSYAGGIGGFGGGGAGWHNSLCRSGGGGGYSGGQGATWSGQYSGGGGGSYISVSATDVETSDGQYNGSATFNGNAIIDLSSYNSGMGYVNIQFVCP